jgi:hypothetical protein
MGQALIIAGILALVAIGAWRSRHLLPFGRQEMRGLVFENAPISVHRKSGAIRIKGSTLVLGPGMPQSNFLESDLYQHTTSARYFSLENGLGHWFLVSFRDSLFENVHLRLSFENQLLGRVDFAWGPQVSAQEWTRERVQADVARYRTFLIHELGSIRTFPCELPWGTVYAARDENAGTPATGVRYKGFEFRAKAR